MRKVVYGGAMSLDGFIAGPDGEYDWIVMDPDIDFAALMARFDTFLIGRKTFEAMRRMADAAPPTPGIRNIVFSRTLRPEDCPQATLSADAEQVVADLRAKPGKDIALFGGSAGVLHGCGGRHQAREIAERVYNCSNPTSLVRYRQQTYIHFMTVGNTVCAAALVMCAGSAACGPMMTRPGDEGVTGYLTTSDGVRLFYRRIGHAAQTAIVPNGIVYFAEFKHLARDRSVIFFDVRNRGLSDTVTDEHNLARGIRNDVDDLDAVRRHFRLKSVDVVGHSYQGMTVILYAMQYQSTLLAPKRHNRVDACRPSSRQIAGEKTDDNEQRRGADECQRVVGRQPEHQALHEPCEADGARRANNAPEPDQDDNVSENQGRNSRARRAECDPDSDLAGAAGDGIRHHAVEPDYGEHSGKRAEHRRQLCHHAFIGDAVIDEGLRCVDTHDRQLRIEPPRLLADRAEQRARVRRCT
jgi:pimeloyl-ACP methyl ester carboxylesterase